MGILVIVNNTYPRGRGPRPGTSEERLENVIYMAEHCDAMITTPRQTRAGEFAFFVHFDVSKRADYRTFKKYLDETEMPYRENALDIVEGQYRRCPRTGQEYRVEAFGTAFGPWEGCWELRRMVWRRGWWCAAAIEYRSVWTLSIYPVVTL